MRSSTSLIRALAVIALPCLIAPGATITPVFQDRDVTAMVIVPPCPPPTMNDNKQAVNFEPLSGTATAQRTCDFAHGLASANQHSTIGPARLDAHGSSQCEAIAAPSTVIHAIPGSHFEVRFQTQVPTRAFIVGHLTASRVLPVVVSYATVRLSIAGGATLFEQGVQPPPGQTESEPVQAQLQLAAGIYSARADAVAAIDATVPPVGEGDASFAVQVLIQRAGDANVDGDVNVADLLAAVAAWGACPAPGTGSGPCLADLDGNGVVNMLDLLLVVNHWGT